MTNDTKHWQVSGTSVPLYPSSSILATEENDFFLSLRHNKMEIAKSQMGVDYRGQNMVKFVQNEKYSAKSGDFLRFCCTFAMSLMILLVLICSTKVSEKSDMAKS